MSNKITETIQGVQVEFTWNNRKDRYEFDLPEGLEDHPDFDEIYDAAEQRAEEMTGEELVCYEEDQRDLAIWERNYRGY